MVDNMGHGALKEQRIRDELNSKREEWRKIRQERLVVKEKLISGGMEKREIRKDVRYRELKKEQEHLTKILKNLEKQLNKLISRESGGVAATKNKTT